MEWSTGDLVWFDTGLGHPLPGEIQEVHRAAQVIVVQAVINGKPQTFTLGFNETHLQPRQDLGPTGVDDMTQLDDLHEASLLWNLRLRYDNGIIYTYAGTILIAVNPYKMFPESYGIEMAKKYCSKPLGTSLSPHLFAIGSAAHAALPAPQVVIISGESGSGKTESTKLVMQYLAAVVPGGGTASAVITEQILEAAPLLEAFGNARTVRNDNSSRFGKYLEIYFKSGSIIGAKITQYLLEKSRIVTQAPAERNYHVFYELLGGLSESERSKYGLLDAEKYFYLNQGGSDCAPGRLDWSSLQGAMQVLGFSEPEREGIVRVLSSVLHLGNVYFHRRQLRHGQEGVELGSDAEVKWAAHLLQIPSEGIMKSLTLRTTETRSEKLLTPLSIDQALDARDAFAKALYSGLFNWLVSRINSIIHKGGTHDAHRISILDIFGFEDLTENSFEQLCINYANESLQLYFNKHVFKLEQAEYARERLEWTPLCWEDNLPVIHLLAKKPVGIFHLLDDESNFPRANDLSFLEKCHYNHALNELYSRPRIGAQEFGITHYAGQVWYSVEGFLEKNRDALRIDVLELLSTSEQPLVLEMTKQMRVQRDMGKTLPRGANGRFVTMKPRTPTVAARFSDSLQQLLQSMSKCNPWFVRCVKPNNDKQALRMDMPCVLQQLRYLGMLDTIKIRKRGYPVRLRFQHFVDRYRHMLKQPIPRGTPYRDLCRFVLEVLPHSNTEGPDFQLGATRVFLRESVHRQLENSRAERLKNAAVVIQKHVRAMLTRKRWKSQKQGAIIIQSAWRSHVTRKRFVELRKAAIKAQALQRGRVARKRVAKMRNEFQRRKQMQKMQKERAAQRVHKEQQMAAERNSLTHLDIPAELAFIISKSEGWTPIHGDRHLVKVVGTVPGPPVADDLPKDIDQFAFGKFSSVYCNGIKLSPRREPIQSPFLSRAAARDQDFQDALAIFKLILRWTGDPSLDNIKEKAIADYIVHKGLSSRGLRDEILVQLCNQVHSVSEPQAGRLWQLMAHCLSSFQPGPPFFKYLLKFISDNANPPIRDILIKKLLRHSQGLQSSRGYPPSWLEWRATAKLSDIALSLSMPDNTTQTVAIDSWTTCEEAAALAISTLNINNFGWTVTLEDGNTTTDSCGLDYVLDLLAEKELFPAFPAAKNDIFRVQGKDIPYTPPEHEPQTPKRPQVPPPEPPTFKRGLSEPPVVPQKTVSKKPNIDNPDYTRKGSHEVLSRESALNDRYFEGEKTRSRSLDNLLNDDDPPDVPPAPAPEPLQNLGLSGSRLNDRYHSAERLAPLREPPPRFVKTGKRSYSSKYMERSETSIRSSAMSDTSEAPSLASHVRRVRVPSQASDVDQFLDDLFSPVLDGSLDELSDARSLAASIRGSTMNDFMEAPLMAEDLRTLSDSRYLSRKIKGGGDEPAVAVADNSAKLDQEVALINEGSLDAYITDLFQPIFVNESIRKLTTKSELADSIKGGGAETSGMNSVLSGKSDFRSPVVNIPDGVDPTEYQQQIQRAFLQSAMQQNLHIQQQLIAQNQALQTLLTQQHSNPTSPTNIKSTPAKKPTVRLDDKKPRKLFDGDTVPPPPPPLPPPVEPKDPQEARPFLDPYGRAKTVRIGKWRWPPPPQGAGGEDYIQFKLRQKKQTNGNSHSGIEWEEFEMEPSAVPLTKVEMRHESAAPKQSKQQRRSFDIGAERPSPNSVGKLKLSSEMRQRLEQVTSGHSVRSSTSNSDRAAPAKLEDTRRAMLEAQLGGNMQSPDSAVKKHIQRMEGGRSQKIAPVWPMNVPPAPEKPPPPPPVRPSNSNSKGHGDLPAFVQRQERDTFGVRDNYGDSWGRAEAAKLDLVYETSFRKEIPVDRDRSRSRSRSRDRENFSEAVWDRSEVEGPSSNNDGREKERRDREYEHAQIMREKESNKVYQPSSKSSKDKKTKASQPSTTPTFKTHMAQKSAQKERKFDPIPRATMNHNKSTDTPDKSDNIYNLPAPVIPAPVPASPSHKIAASACLTYNRVPWKLRVRKEIFSPTEPIGPPIALDLLFLQIACDVLGVTPSLRISSEERQSALTLLGNHGITADNMKSQVRAIVKRHLVDMAREWPVYFSRLFVVNGSPQMPEVSILAVSHNGVFLVKREADNLTIVNNLTFNDLYSVTILPRPSALQICLRNGNRFTIYASKAQAIQSMVQSFLQEYKQAKGTAISSGARQAAQILNVPIEHLEASIQHQNHHGDNGHTTNGHHESPRNGHDRHQTASPDEYPPQYVHRKNSLNTQESTSPNSHHRMDESIQMQSNTKHSLLQFAIQHFRNDFADDKSGRASDKRSSSGRGVTHADLVKWQNVPLRAPLLRLPPDLSPLAIECFDCILKYSGDSPMEPELTEVKCVYTILMHCHKYLALRDEVYCQLMKQTTANRSPSPDSSQRAWRLLSILAAYFGCSDALKPYLIEHLNAAASDRRRTCHGTAGVCLSNLRKTARCGGRKNVPSVEEVTAVSAGRSARRQIYRLPGGAERVVNTRCSTVVSDVIAELCALLGIESEIEQQEFSLYCIVQGDAFTMPLAADEYILDVTTELLKSGQPFYLIFCRSVWHFPLKRDPAPTPLYIEVLFNQVAPDYLEGLLLELPGNGAPNPDYVRDMARIAAILHRAADLNHVPVLKEIKFLLPKPALALRELRPAQWVALVQSAWPAIAGLSTIQVKAQFLNVLAAWPLFGSSFFAIKRVWTEEAPAEDPTNAMWKELILALNRKGVLFLDPNTHETLQNWSYTEVISTRKVRSEDGALFLDMKVGNLLQQRIVRVQTEQAHEISRLVRQYITMAQIVYKDIRN